MSLSVLTASESEKWDRIVRSFSNYDVYYLSGYVKAFQLHGDGEPLLFYYEGKNIRGINVVMNRDIAKDPHFIGKLPENTYFDFATPYGYGGWLFEGEGERDTLYAVYQKWCRSHGIISEFVRFHPVLKNNMFSFDFYDVIPLGATIAMDLSSPEDIWKNITSKNRNMIRKAEKSGIQIYSGRSPRLFEIFRSIYNLTMDKDHAASYYYFQPIFYASILNDLSENAQIFYAQLGEKIIAASILLSANGRMSYHLSGSIQAYQNLAPSNLLLYKAALWGCANGCKTLHLGGGVGSGEDGLFKFKKSFFRGEPCRYHIGKKVFIEEQYQWLVAERADLPKSQFFPQYRALKKDEK